MDRVRKSGARGSLLAALLLLALPAATAAQSEPPARGLSTAWHVVRPGDTLIGLSARLSGSAERWRENWRLNPEVQDPNLLLPGQRLRLLMPRPVPPRAARVMALSRKVETRPTPIPWQDSVVDELLVEDDALRTRERSSAELAFTDGVELRVTESSVVYLAALSAEQGGVARDEVEIVEGEADLGARDPSRPPTGIEVVVGDARATPEPSAQGILEARARRPAAGGAQVMLYEGEGAVEAAGARVELSSGTGTTVAEGAPPAPPERLLPAPRLAEPAAGAELGFRRPQLAWEAVPGAASYSVELCADERCARLLERRLGLAETELALAELDHGVYHWRVNAVAPSGLDGFPSPTASFRIRGSDRQPPTVGRVAAYGPSVRRGRDLILGPGARLEVTAEDAISGLGSWTYLLDDRPIDGESWLGGPWPEGLHQARVVVRDRAGNEAASEPFAFVSDPNPPRIDWQVADASVLARYAAGTPAAEMTERAPALSRLGVLLEWSTDGESWQPLRRPGGALGERGSRGVIDAARPQLFLRAPLGDPFAAASDLQLAAGEVVRLWAEDAGSGVDRLAFGIDGDSLWIEATDLLGTTERLEWPLAAP